MKVRFFDPGYAYQQIKPEIDAAMQDVLERGDLILRKDVDEFEEVFANYVGTKYAVAVNSGTDALLLSLMYYGITEGHTVLAPSYTFRATVDSAARTGAKVLLYDKDDIPVLGKRVTAWIPAHIAGEVPAWMEDKIKEAKKKGIIVIEDAAQAIGAAPVWGDTACYSFYPAKILGCYGDGGAIATNDPKVYDWLKRARNHFKGERGPVGLNSRLDNIQAAVLNVKLKYLDEAITKRKDVARMYDNGLVGVGKPEERDVYQDYIIETPNPVGLKAYLEKFHIETMENGYPFAEQFDKGPQTIQYEATTLRLPCNEHLTKEEVQYVIQKVNAYPLL